jgi:AcrR family transcriptional regulator/DNA-binding MarR family transcriptional regulator
MATGNETRSASIADGSADGSVHNGRSRGHVAEIQRTRMLGAALQAIDESGYAQFTVAQVIERAKVSRKTFYDVFEDREDCFVALFEQALARAEARVGDAYAGESSWRDAVRAGLAAILELIDEEPALARLCVVDALGGGRRVLERRGRALRRMTAAVQRGQAERDGRREPAEVTAEGVVGAVFAVLHARLLRRGEEPYVELLGQLMSMIVLPYLGAAVAARELARPLPAKVRATVGSNRSKGDALVGLRMRLTYRTVSVLNTIGAQPGASNREVANRAGISDQGQMSKLLARLERLELVENVKDGAVKGAPNRWRLTPRGVEVERATRPM